MSRAAAENEGHQGREARPGPPHLQELQLLHTAVQQLEGALGHLPRPLQEEQQGALAREQVAAQVQQRGLLLLDQLALLHVYGFPEDQAIPALHRLAEKGQPVGTI